MNTRNKKSMRKHRYRRNKSRKRVTSRKQRRSRKRVTSRKHRRSRKQRRSRKRVASRKQRQSIRKYYQSGGAEPMDIDKELAELNVEIQQVRAAAAPTEGERQLKKQQVMLMLKRKKQLVKSKAAAEKMAQNLAVQQAQQAQMAQLLRQKMEKESGLTPPELELKEGMKEEEKQEEAEMEQLLHEVGQEQEQGEGEELAQMEEVVRRKQKIIENICKNASEINKSIENYSPESLLDEINKANDLITKIYPEIQNDKVDENTGNAYDFEGDDENNLMRLHRVLHNGMVKHRIFEVYNILYDVDPEYGDNSESGQSYDDILKKIVTKIIFLAVWNGLPREHEEDLEEIKKGDPKLQHMAKSSKPQQDEDLKSDILEELKKKRDDLEQLLNIQKGGADDRDEGLTGVEGWVKALEGKIKTAREGEGDWKNFNINENKTWPANFRLQDVLDEVKDKLEGSADRYPEIKLRYFEICAEVWAHNSKTILRTNHNKINFDVIGADDAIVKNCENQPADWLVSLAELMKGPTPVEGPTFVEKKLEAARIDGGMAIMREAKNVVCEKLKEQMEEMKTRLKGKTDEYINAIDDALIEEPQMDLAELAEEYKAIVEKVIEVIKQLNLTIGGKPPENWWREQKGGLNMRQKNLNIHIAARNRQREFVEKEDERRRAEAAIMVQAHYRSRRSRRIKEPRMVTWTENLFNYAKDTGSIINVTTQLMALTDDEKEISEDLIKNLLTQLKEGVEGSYGDVIDLDHLEFIFSKDTNYKELRSTLIGPKGDNVSIELYKDDGDGKPIIDYQSGDEIYLKPPPNR